MSILSRRVLQLPLYRGLCTLENVRQKTLATTILGRFPPVEFAFAYGSGISAQAGNRGKGNMLDLVFAVEDSAAWHHSNMLRNSDDYSFLRHGGGGFLAKFQDVGGAHIYYNTLVPFDNRMMKYGVISCQRLVEDMLQWTNLYVGGRLHKPVSMLKHSSPKYQQAYLSNLSSAVTVALLLLPPKFSVKDLYIAIAGISYMGDFRMIFGENPYKVRSIVNGNLEGFQATYRSTLHTIPHLYMSDTLCEQDVSIAVRQAQLLSLPIGLRQRLLDQMLYSHAINSVQGERPTEDEIWQRLASHKDLDKFIQCGVASIVRGSAMTQAIKGILTAGIVRTTIYSTEKVKKMMKAIMKGY